MAVGAFSLAWTLNRAPSQVVLTSKGIHLIHGKSKKSHAWRDVGWKTASKTYFFNHQKIEVFNTGGKKIFQLTEAFDKYDYILKILDKAVKQKGLAHTEKMRLAKARENIFPACLIGSIALIAGIFLIKDGYEEQRAARDLEQIGIQTEARITERVMAPNGVTPRLYYEITTADGLVGTRNAEVTPEYWASLENVQTVPVIYLPSNPDYSRLLTGEPEEKAVMESPIFSYVLSGGVIILALFLFISSAFCWYGLDLQFDEKKFKFSILPYGEGD